MAVGAVVARIISQYSDKGSKAAQRDIAKLGQTIDAFGKKSARAFGFAAIASAAALAKIGKDSIMAASDVSQQFGALDAVFGKNSEQLKDFSKSMVDYGLSTADAARYAALLGTQLKGLGLQEQDAIERTQKLQILAADLAATYGGTTADAVAALSSTFKGEYNPIERYGVAIRKSDITARVAAKGLGKLTGDLLKAAEAQEAYELIITKTSAAQGQSRREYDTLAAQLQRVDATFINLKASLGIALLPVMEKFASLLITKVLPKVEEFVDANKDQLAASFAVAAEFAVKLLEALVAFGDWVANNTGKVKVLAGIIATMFVISGVAKFILAIEAITAAMAILRATAIGTAIATAFATGGVSIATAATALAAVGATALVTKNAFKMTNGEIDKTSDKLKNLTKEQIAAADVVDEQSRAAAARAAAAASAAAIAADKKSKAAAAAAAAAAKKAAAAAKKAAAEAAIAAKKRADSLKAIAALTKAGAKPRSEDDPIQLEAARLNLIKQGQIAEQARFAAFVNARKFEIEQNNAAAEAAMRYNDILTALADTKITPAEFELLAAKWGITTTAAQLYVQTIISVRDNEISASEVAKLAETWGITYQEAAKYLDFFAALNDGTLSDAEIGKLQEKWSLTEKQVLQYAAVFAAADDGKIDLSEVINLGDQWGLTKKETEAYIAKILEEFGYDPSLLAAPVEAEGAWLLAYGSVDAYKEISEGTFTYDPSITDGSDAASIGWISASAALSAYVAAAANANSIVIKPPVIPPVIPPIIPPVIPPGFGGNDNEPRYVPPRGTVLEMATGGIVNSATLAIIGEAGPEAVIPLSKMDSMGGQNITINVGGSVISEGDLVAVIRDQLLGLQQSGKSITLSAISI
jgi:hypothetical protein